MYILKYAVLYSIRDVKLIVKFILYSILDINFINLIINSEIDLLIGIAISIILIQILYSNIILYNYVLNNSLCRNKWTILL